MEIPSGLDRTHDPRLRSWVEDANGHLDFPIQNLPLGIYRPPGQAPRGGIAIGDHILDLPRLLDSGLLELAAREAYMPATGATLNAWMEQGAAARNALRHAVSGLLSREAPVRPELLHRAADCTLDLPAKVGDYSDFYAGLHHATNVGRLFRPDSPLTPNYKWVPIGYHGRASSLRVSGAAVRRPKGQRKQAVEALPSYGPARKLDFELELGIWVGPGNQLGEAIPIASAHRHVAGFSLLNDWSARDMQAWEYQPLGPFLAKSFQTTVSGWIVTPEALAPFRSAQPSREQGDPELLPYLFDPEDQQQGALDIKLEVFLRTRAMREAGVEEQRVTRTNTLNLYWTPQQLLTHQASNGCSLAAGDLLGTGTISSEMKEGFGSLLELTLDGTDPIALVSGEERRFLEDGDEVIFKARAEREGYVPIGFGECRAMVLPASPE